jgi:hypothetical protein
MLVRGSRVGIIGGSIAGCAAARLGREHDEWPDLLAAYDTERTAAGVSLVHLGRRLGRDLVEHTPDWGTMTAGDFEAWTKRTLSGERLYFYGNATAADR